MMAKNDRLRLLGFLLGSAALGTADSAAAATVELKFAARVGDAAARCGVSYPNVGLSRASIFLQDFRVYVSAVRLLDKDGREVPVALTPDQLWQSEQVALLDFEDATGNCNGNGPTNDVVRGTVPDGEYRGVVFELAVPFEVNHQDPTLAGPPLNFSALTWPWAIGYKFTTIDFDTKPAETASAAAKGDGAAGHGADAGHGATGHGAMGHGPKGDSATGFSVHLGSTECASAGPRVPPQAPCANPNRPTYRFEAFDPQKDVLVMDLAALLAGTDVTVNMPQSPSGCMAFVQDDDCIDIMDRFGLPFRGKASAGQKFFRVDERRP